MLYINSLYVYYFSLLNVARFLLDSKNLFQENIFLFYPANYKFQVRNHMTLDCSYPIRQYFQHFSLRFSFFRRQYRLSFNTFL